MSDLEQFEQQPAPRHALAEKYAGKKAPMYGFVLVGFLFAYISLVPLLLPAGAAYLVDNHLPDWTLVPMIGVSSALALWAIVASWRWFIRWVRERRSGMRTLVCDGTLTTGEVVSVRSGQIHWTGIRFEMEGGSYRLLAPLAEPVAEGTPARVLCHPDTRLAFAFEPRGKAVVVKIKAAKKVPALPTAVARTK
jgi:hypothetical protein